MKDDKPKAPHILILCAQGGRPAAEFHASIGDALQKHWGDKGDVSIVTLRDVDRETIRRCAPSLGVEKSFEQFRRESLVADVECEIARLDRTYGGVNWWAVAASERSIIDASFLVGGLGQRRESRAYVEALIVNMVCHFERLLSSGRFTAVLSQTADSLITHVFYLVARHFDLQIVTIVQNSWIPEDGRHGFIIGRDEFQHSDRMEAIYRSLKRRGMTEDERQRVLRYKQAIADFDANREYPVVTGATFGTAVLSPHLKMLLAYLRENAARNKDVEYYKIDAVAKARANLARLWRRWRMRSLPVLTPSAIPKRSVFYALQFQPEQSTLVGGIFFANQIAVLENIAKAMPFGYTLIVKEHPRAVGTRPTWQYLHLAGFPNVLFCDGNSKEIIRCCEATITITGTVGLEAMALDKPAVVLGNVNYDFAEILYRPKSWSDFAATMRRILIDREYDKNARRHELIDQFFLSYLLARIPVLLKRETAPEIAAAIRNEIDMRGTGSAGLPETSGTKREEPAREAEQASLETE